MNRDYGHCRAPFRLPIAFAKNRYTGLNFDETPLRCPQFESSPMKKGGEGLHMSAPQESPRPELQRLWFNVLIGLSHRAILNGKVTTVLSQGP